MTTSLQPETFQLFSDTLSVVELVINFWKYNCVVLLNATEVGKRRVNGVTVKYFVISLNYGNLENSNLEIVNLLTLRKTGINYRRKTCRGDLWRESSQDRACALCSLPRFRAR